MAVIVTQDPKVVKDFQSVPIRVEYSGPTKQYLDQVKRNKIETAERNKPAAPLQDVYRYLGNDPRIRKSKSRQLRQKPQLTIRRPRQRAVGGPMSGIAGRSGLGVPQ